MNSSSCIASGLQPLDRQDLAIKVLAKKEMISHLANQEQVSRKFLYQQRDLAQKALNNAFDPKEPENQVLYYLPVTQSIESKSRFISFCSSSRPETSEYCPKL